MITSGLVGTLPWVLSYCLLIKVHLYSTLHDRFTNGGLPWHKVTLCVSCHGWSRITSFYICINMVRCFSYGHLPWWQVALGVSCYRFFHVISCLDCSCFRSCHGCFYNAYCYRCIYVVPWMNCFPIGSCLDRKLLSDRVSMRELILGMICEEISFIKQFAFPKCVANIVNCFGSEFPWVLS